MGFVGHVINFARKALRLGKEKSMIMIDKPLSHFGLG
jgi:RNase P/RNase MRP subunit p29